MARSNYKTATFTLPNGKRKYVTARTQEELEEKIFNLWQHRTNGKIHRIAVVAERTLWITSELLFAKAH